NDILDFSKLEAGHIEFMPVATDIEALARDVLDVLAVQASAKGIELKLDSSIHGIALMVDPLRLRQVFMNLVGNAVKFTDRGSVAVVLTADVGRNSAVLHCAVNDTGCGIPADLTDHLFERFSQVDGSTSRRYRGTGLGLAICKGIVEAMGGTIGVESEAGQGSTFWFTCTVPSAAIIAGKEQRHVA
ncbi:MAG TPA: ATP-binding protein, partial [Rhizomicrobium sp.]|nr:ATP-binding protein [Rhizomicrobium sp.]